MVSVLEEVPLRMISQAASRRNITVVLRQADLPHAMQRLHEEFFAISGAPWMSSSSSATARWAGWSRSWPPAQDVEIAGRVDDGRDEWRAGRCGDRLLDRRRAARRTSRTTSQRRLPLSSSARPAGASTPTRLRAEAAQAGLGVVAAANFSIGVNLFQLIVAEAARLMQAQPQYGAWIHEAHHAAKRDAPSGTALLLRDAHDRRRVRPPDRHVVDAGPARFPARTRSDSTVPRIRSS